MLKPAGILNIETIVDGIETETELMWARKNGAAYVQGHLIGTPA